MYRLPLFSSVKTRPKISNECRQFRYSKVYLINNKTMNWIRYRSINMKVNPDSNHLRAINKQFSVQIRKKWMQQHRSFIVRVFKRSFHYVRYSVSELSKRNTVLFKPILRVYLFLSQFWYCVFLVSQLMDKLVNYVSVFTLNN